MLQVFCILESGYFRTRGGPPVKVWTEQAGPASGRGGPQPDRGSDVFRQMYHRPLLPPHGCHDLLRAVLALEHTCWTVGSFDCRRLDRWILSLSLVRPSDQFTVAVWTVGSSFHYCRRLDRRAALDRSLCCGPRVGSLDQVYVESIVK
eukprot:1177031-Prorocentrum_minimum.AAC.3